MNRWKAGLTQTGIIIAILIFSFSACKKSTNSEANLDREAILRFVAEDTTTFPKEIIDPTSPDTSGNPKIADVDSIMFWWRQLLDRTRNVELSIHSEDSIHPYPYAYVTITDMVQGNFHIRGWEGISWVAYIKPFMDKATKSAYFEKRGTNETIYRGWRLVGVSGVLVQSVPECTRSIDSVHVISQEYDTVLTEDDITDTTSLEYLLNFNFGDSINVTVYTGDATDNVYLHTFRCIHPRCWPHRYPLINNGDGSFSGFWIIPQNLSGYGIRRCHAAIDVIEHSTLYGGGEDQYDSRIWGLIYKITQP